MTISQTTNRIHPLVAAAAVSVTLVSALGIAAITGILPNSHGLASDAHRASAEMVSASKQSLPLAPTLATKQRPATHYNSNVVQHTANSAPQPVTGQVTSNGVTSPPYAPAAKPEPHNSPVGIGVGAVIGGVLGNQVGSGDGKTLATIAGAIGGGYIGNEVAKKNQ